MGGAAKHLQTEEDKSSSQNFTEEIPQDSDHLQNLPIIKSKRTREMAQIYPLSAL